MYFIVGLVKRPLRFISETSCSTGVQTPKLSFTVLKTDVYLFSSSPLLPVSLLFIHQMSVHGIIFFLIHILLSYVLDGIRVSLYICSTILFSSINVG